MADGASVSAYLSKIGRRGADKTNNQLSPEQRKKKAKKAAAARWKKAREAKAEKAQ